MIIHLYMRLKNEWQAGTQLEKQTRELQNYHWRRAHKHMLRAMVVVHIFWWLYWFLVFAAYRPFLDDRKNKHCWTGWSGCEDDVRGVCCVFDSDDPDTCQSPIYHILWARVLSAFTMGFAAMDMIFCDTHGRNWCWYPTTIDALEALTRTVRGIYRDDPRLIIVQAAQYINPHQTIGADIQALQTIAPYTPLKLARELSAHKVLKMYDLILFEQQSIDTLIKAYVQQNGAMTCLDKESFINILAFVAGANLAQFSKEKLMHGLQREKKQRENAVAKYAQEQREIIPKRLQHFEKQLQPQRAEIKLSR